MEMRVLNSSEYESALQLVWKVFQEYEAPEYPEQGVKSFYESIHAPQYVEQLKLYGAFDSNKLIGVLATRNNGNHIALFFILSEYHRKGIGRKLFERVCGDNISGTLTVNSSPYAVEIYRKLGFKEMSSEQIEDGIRYTPMQCKLRG